MSTMTHCPWLALCSAGLLLISAGSPCNARRLLSSESENHHRPKLDSDGVIEVVVVLAVVALLVALALLRLLVQCCGRLHCCRCGSPVGHAAEEEEASEGRSAEFSSKCLSPFVVFKVQRNILEEDDPKSIPPTMVRRSPCGSPEPRHWARHVSTASRHHQNPAAATILRDIAPVSQAPLKEFSYLSLAKATRDFDKGHSYRSGVMYTGHLLFDDTALVKEVAIKRFHKNITDDIEQIIRQDLRRKKYMLQHRNLVTLFGYCFHDGKLYLVYDCMSYYSLDYELFGEKEYPHRPLTLSQRHSIIKDAARGLLQLHDRNAFHGAVKSCNIMLEPSSTGFRGRLADFRYSKLLAEHRGSEPRTTLQLFLYGNVASASGGPPSLEKDVLHFGGMMLEVLCGRRLFARDHLPAGYSSLLDWVEELGGEARLDALDGNAKKASDFNSALANKLLRLSLRCCNPVPSNRPTIRTVLAELSEEVQTEISPRHVRTSSEQPSTNYISLHMMCAK